jgi:hypothetical protein
MADMWAQLFHAIDSHRAVEPNAKIIVFFTTARQTQVSMFVSVCWVGFHCFWIAIRIDGCSVVQKLGWQSF